MKKNIYLLLLASLAIAGCVATREIPLTKVVPNYIPDSVLQTLPELPTDLSKTKYIDVPYPMQEYKDGPNCYPSLTMDDIESYEIVQLEGLPYADECRVSSIQQDDDLLFVTLQGKKETAQHLHAIYTRQGKLVAQLGEQIARETSPENDLQYNYTNGLQLDRENKEVYFENSRKLVYFDYKGNYKRTELPPFMPSQYHTTGGMRVAFGKKDSEGIVVDKHGTPRAVAFKNDNRHYTRIANKELCRIDDDLMSDYEYSDTLWQILPDRKVARYVYTGYATSPRNPETPDLSTEEYEKAWQNRAEKAKVFAGKDFVLTSLAVLKERRTWTTGNYHLYDTSSGHSRVWSGPQASGESFFLYFPVISMLPDATLVYAESPYYIKMVHSASLEKKIKVGITPEDGEMIRSLKLDGGPVLFFVKLKKF